MVNENNQQGLSTNSKRITKPDKNKNSINYRMRKKERDESESPPRQ
jgi:hypothetical protein